VAPSAAKKLTALVTTLVANTVLAAAAARAEEDGEDAADFALRTAAALARSPPVVSARGANVESSLLVGLSLPGVRLLTYWLSSSDCLHIGCHQLNRVLTAK
jgi:hypothetical protein